jgi:myo-inositol-1(or 4)-monophosphatase
MQVQGFIQTSFEACQEIIASLKQSETDTLFQKHDVGHGGDISIGADMIAEKILIKHLCTYGKIFSEESGYIGEGELTVVIDPLDGSDNFKSQFPYYGTSIALIDSDRSLCGIVCNFANGDFIARGDGEVTCKNIFDLETKENVAKNAYATVGLFEKAYDNPNIVSLLKSQRLKFRSPGAVALSLAYAHYVKYVLFFGTMRDYDIVAGIHISKDLFCHRDENCIIISKDEQTFEILCKLIILKDSP